MIEQLEKTLEEIETDGEKPDLKAVKHELDNVLDALNKLKVSGFDNLDKLLGCMIVVKQILRDEVGEDGG